MDDTDDEPSSVRRPQVKQPTRPGHSERPKRHRSRHSDHSDYKSKSSEKSNKSTPKTIREVINRRRDYGPPNRYNASEFSSIKSNLLKDSVELNATMSSKPNKIPSINTKDESPPKKPKPDPVNKSPPAKIESPLRTPTPKPSVVVTKSTKTETTVQETINGQPAGNNTAKGKHSADFLEHTETQMALDSAKDQQEEAHSENYPESPTEKEPNTKTSKTVTTVTTTTTVIDDGKEVRTEVSENQGRSSPEKSSSQTSDKKPGQPQPASRTPSRTSMQQIYKHRAPTDSKTTSPQRRPSIDQNIGNRRGSITSNRHVNGHVSRLEQAYGSRRPSVVSTVNQHQRNNSTVTQTEHTQPANESVLPENTSNKPADTVTPKLNDTTNAENERRSPTKTEKRDNVSMRGENKGTSPTRKPPSVANVVQQVMKEKPKEKMYDRYQSNGNVETKEDNKRKAVNANNKAKQSDTDNRSGAQPTRSVQVDRKVSEQVSETINTKPAVTNKTNMRASQHQRRARTPPRRQSLVNGYDSRVSREDYERNGHDGKRATRRSDSGDRKQRRGSQSPRSKARKRSTSSERRRGKGRKGSVERKKGKPTKSDSRFPAIEGRSSRLTTSPKTRVDYSEHVEENEYERVITPKPKETGAKNWKDLVQKYMRQPSPKVGRTEHKVIIDASETDEDDDEIDIFERAKKKYVLVSDDED